MNGKLLPDNNLSCSRNDIFFMRTSDNRLNCQGYTTLEVFVVFGVVSVLAAMLFPLGAAAKASSQRSDDLANIGQLARAASIYAVDADDTFMAVGAPALEMTWSPVKNPNQDAAGHRWQGWGLRLAPYAKSYDSFRSALYPKTMAFTGACAHASGAAMTNNYAYNWMLGSDGSYKADGYIWSPDRSRHFDHPASVASVAVPANTAEFMLSGVLSPEGSDLECLGTTVQASDFTNELGRSALSEDGSNIAFTDAHARFIADTRLSPTTQQRKLYHLPDRSIWLEPTMPNSAMGYQNVGVSQNPLVP